MGGTKFTSKSSKSPRLADSDLFANYLAYKQQRNSAADQTGSSAGKGRASADQMTKSLTR